MIELKRLFEEIISITVWATKYRKFKEELFVDLPGFVLSDEDQLRDSFVKQEWVSGTYGDGSTYTAQTTNPSIFEKQVMAKRNLEMVWDCSIDSVNVKTNLRA